MSRQEYIQKIQSDVDRIVDRNEQIPGVQILYKPEGNAQDFSWVSGSYDSLDDPFHTASVGKVFTAVLIGRKVEEGALDWDSSIDDYLDSKWLDGLFFLDGKDYSGEVQIKHLLSHTSGVADYFEDPVTEGADMAEWVLSERDKVWTPEELLRFSSKKQIPVGKPGEVFHYSDTGYILLGILAQELYGKPFYQILEDELFAPLKMDQTSMLFFPSRKNQDIGPTFLYGVDVSQFKSISMDWAGGGVRTTVNDMARFAQAMMDYQVLTKETLKDMFQFDYSYMRGIHYGLGFMEFQFGEYFPTLKTLPQMKGHMGVLGTQLMMDFDNNSYLIINFASTDGADDSVKTAIKILSFYSAIR